MHYNGTNHTWRIDILVSIGKDYSKEHEIGYSVPQDSIQGLVSFNCYCSTLTHQILENIEISGFADNHTLLSKFDPNSVDDKVNCMAKLASCLNNVNV